MERIGCVDSVLTQSMRLKEKKLKRKKMKQQRILGYDFARAIAVFGMVIVNFKIVMGAEQAGPGWLVWLSGLLDGRAAAIFVVLAGIGLSLLTQKARLVNDKVSLKKSRIILYKRALFLLIVGLLYTALWPADIIHFYGIYIFLGAMCLSAPNKLLWNLVISFNVVFILFLLLFNYDAGWDWNTITYIDFWTINGMIRHLFFNGFHPVFPWVSFLFFGMWLGRQDLTSKMVRKKFLIVAGLTVLFSEALSFYLIKTLTLNWNLMPAEEIAALFGTTPIPPMPLYILAGGGLAVIVIILSIIITEKFSNKRWTRPVIAAGQMALTLYAAHVIIGMGFLEAIGLLEKQSISFAVISALIFNIAAILFSHFWIRKFKRGPLELVMRKITG